MFAAPNFFLAGGGAGACSATYGERFFATCSDYCGVATYSWIAPAGVYHVSVVAVGAGAIEGGGGGLGYKNNYAVTPGNSYTVRAGADPNLSGRCSYFISTCIVKGGGGVSGGAGGTYTGDGGGNGGAYSSLKGGGAGGYAGNGNSGTGGAAANGGSTNAYGGAGGGGVGLYGQGTSATANTGGGGSPITISPGGGNRTQGTAGGVAYCYAYCCCCFTYYIALGGPPGIFGGGSGKGNGNSIYGGRGAVRIIYPGNARSFPSTNTGAIGVPFIVTVGYGYGSFTVPTGATKLKVEIVSQPNGTNCHATGVASGGGGGGGAYASTSCLSVTAGNLVYWATCNGTGITGLQSWANKTTNSAPTSSANGAAATSAIKNVGGSAASAIGTVTYSGGNGGTGASGGTAPKGGGGGAANPCGSGANGGNGFATVLTGAGGGGGTGGLAAAVGNTGTATAGGAGGAGGSVGTGGAGAFGSTDAGLGLNGGGGGGGIASANSGLGNSSNIRSIWTCWLNGDVYGTSGGNGGNTSGIWACYGGAGGGVGKNSGNIHSAVILTFSP
jgi:hypothetical protein